jgi:hypothetical protein
MKMTLSDETLMAYADGALRPSERERIAQLAARDPEVRARLEVFAATGQAMAEVFDAHMRSPLPEGLMRIVERAQPLPEVKAARVGFVERVRGLFAQATPAGLAFASVATLAAGIGAATLLLHGGEGEAELAGLVQKSGAREVASGALERALEGLQGSQKEQAALGGGKVAQLSVPLTFRDHDGNYCRQYELGLATGTFGGIACHTRSNAAESASKANAQWTIRYRTQLASAHRASGGRAAAPAGGKYTELGEKVMSMMDGIALGPSDEAAAIAAGWNSR